MGFLRSQSAKAYTPTNVFTGLKTSSDYLSSFHETARKLYDPTEIERLVKVKSDIAIHEVKKQVDELKGLLDHSSLQQETAMGEILSSFYTYVAHSQVFLSEEEFISMTKKIEFEKWRNRVQIFGMGIRKDLLVRDVLPKPASYGLLGYPMPMPIQFDKEPDPATPA